MSNLTVLAFGDKGIRFERRDDRIWVSLTDMAKVTGKRVNDWTRLDSTIEYLTEFETITGIPVMVSNVGGTPETTGTWAIEEVAIDFASWCNVGFRIWVAKQIRTLITEGSVNFATPDPQQSVLPPADVRVKDLKETLAFFDIDIENPRFKQGIQDLVGDILLGLTKNSLNEPSERWLGVVERAEELGYKVGSDLSLRTLLGKHCVQYPLKRKQEKRLCNGTQRLINVYLSCSELDSAIESFFDA